MIVLDTNVVSELMKPQRDPRVDGWAQHAVYEDQKITAFTVQEVVFGLSRLPAGRRRQALTAAWQRLEVDFADSILGYGAEEARLTGLLLAGMRTRGLSLSQPDAQIAGICLLRNASLITRNIQDFASIPELKLVNPFQ